VYETLARVFTLAFFTYFAVYNTANLVLLVIAFLDVRRKLWMRGAQESELLHRSPYTPPLSILVPAYNEAITIVQSLRSLIGLRFPRFEILVVNDGSTDNTMEVLRRELALERTDIPYREGIRTATVRGLYHSTLDFPPSVKRLVVVDKENGGKADALNAGINVSSCPYVISMDADSIIDDNALAHIFKIVLERGDVAAVGGQVVVANGCTIENGRVVRVGLPRSHLARIQIVEYIRSFTTARTALSRLEALLVISGVFCIFEKSLLIRVGGYLTEHVRSKLAREYTGPGAGTVCEDMEIVVRLHRYLREKGLDRVILSVPYPICWTEVPERAGDLAKQRGRWFRGFMEIMTYYRGMIFNRRMGRVGLLGWPWFFLFEFVGLFAEAFGYVSVPVLAIAGILDPYYLIVFLGLAVGYGTLVSYLSILVAFWSEPVAYHDYEGHSLLTELRSGEIALLLLYCLLENLGYRQLTVRWRLKGLWDFLRGNTSWEKFERIGFGEHAA
jgi:cellulose synthase/poly-beta-1,6-N-acetylglucosamine synthase-like glycosyltransferase